MARRTLILVLLLGATGAGLTYYGRVHAPGGAAVDAARRRGAGGAVPTSPAGDAHTIAELARRVAALESQLASEAHQRRQLAQHLDAVVGEVAALHATTNGAAAGSPEQHVAAIDPADGAAAADRHDMAAADEPRSAVERALIAAGVDAATAVDIKRRRDEVTMAEMYLRDQATREGWLDTPRFRDEMDAVERQRTSIRDEVGDDGYDRYLAALGEPNRVRVDEVFTESPAASAGLQPGDVVLRYGEDRIFAPDDLVAATRRGTAGEPVRVQVLRHGERIELDVPRGPLGLRIAASQADPGEG